ncbi:MAG: endonuclease/exonuclease/phosphatase family protein [Rhodothermales bacterium]
MRKLFTTILLALDALLLVVFLGGYMAYFIRPDVLWWIELVAVVLPYVGLAVILATIPIVVAGRWRLALLHGVLILLMVVRANPMHTRSGASDASGDTLSVLTFNVPRWWGYEMETKTKTAEMSALIQRADPDVIGLQEAPSTYHPESPHFQAPAYVQALHDSLGYGVVASQSTGPTYTPQPVFSRQQLARQDEYQLRRSSNDPVYTHVTRTQIRWKHRDIAVYNVHLRTFGEKPWEEESLPFFRPRNLLPYLRQYRDAYDVRAWEVEEILSMVDGEDMPVILLGDLNSTPNNWVYGRVTDRLRDAFGEKGKGWGMTYHTRLPLVRIDYVFVSEEWDVISARVLDAYLSDHLPVLVGLRLRN